MTYVSVVTLVAYALVLGVLAGVSVVDCRERRIPNALVLLLGLLWVAWRVVLGLAGKYMGLGFYNTLLSPAPTVMVPPGLPLEGVSLAGGILGAVVLGGGLLVLSAAYEAIARRESFGGGDIKLMAVLGLFLGWERGLVCLLAACLLSLVYAGVRRLLRHFRRDNGDVACCPASGAADSALQDTMPFAPFIALGTLIAFAA